MNKILQKNLIPNIYWAKIKMQDRYELIMVSDANYRPDYWFEEGFNKVEGFCFGWDGKLNLSNYEYFIPANLIMPNGKNI